MSNNDIHSIKGSFFSGKDFKRSITATDAAKRYKWAEVVDEDTKALRLSTPAVFTNYAGYDNKRVASVLTVIMPKRQLVIDKHGHWPFEALRESNIEPAYNDLANRIARYVIGRRDNARYGIIPGDFKFDPAGRPIFTVTMDRKDAYFVAFYSNVCPYAFAGLNCYLTLRLGTALDDMTGTFLVIMPIARVDRMLERGTAC